MDYKKIESPSWAEIDLSALAHNLGQVKNLLSPDTKIMAVVKANAYGHGAVEVSKTLIKSGAHMLGVAFFSEALELREAGITSPLMIMSGVIDEPQLTAVVENDLQIAVYERDTILKISQAARQLGKRALVHIKIDTGMGRLGITPDEALAFAKFIKEQGGIEIAGLFSHFACAEDSPPVTFSQLEKFQAVCEELKAAGFNIKYRHMANSGAIINYPQTHLDMVRPGLMLYGAYPDPKLAEKIQLKPVLSLKSRIVFLKKVPSQTAISYGHTYTADAEKIIATMPLGYADGFNRLLSNKGVVLVNGQRVSVVGRVCMDLTMLDVTNVPDVKTGTPVTIIGRDGDQEITADEIACRIGTIPYEVMCSVGHRVERVYI